MTRDQAIAKIKKCLALAKSQNPHEAAAAMRQAQKLMAEHSLTEHEITLADVTESGVNAISQGNNLWANTLGQIVGKAFGCEVFYRGGNFTKKKCIFVGVGAAAEVASYAYEVLSKQCAKARREHVAKQPKTCKPITKTARGDAFALGWVRGVMCLLNKFVGSERDQELLTSYMQTKHPDMKTTESKDRSVGRNVRDSDTVSGIVAGRNAQLQRAVNGGVQQGLLT